MGVAPVWLKRYEQIMSLAHNACQLCSGPTKGPLWWVAHKVELVRDVLVTMRSLDCWPICVHNPT
jgi:hypothetical protein